MCERAGSALMTFFSASGRLGRSARERGGGERRANEKSDVMSSCGEILSGCDIRCARRAGQVWRRKFDAPYQIVVCQVVDVDRECFNSID